MPSIRLIFKDFLDEDNTAFKKQAKEYAKNYHGKQRLIWFCEGSQKYADTAHSFDQYAHIGFANLKAVGMYAGHTMAYQALERFTPQGPLAVLPYHAYPKQRAEASHVLAWCSEDKTPNMEKLRQLLKGRFLIQNLDVDWRGHVPLYAYAHAKAKDKNSVYLGNAWQTLHPVAGQGLNLGIRQMMRATQSWQDAWVNHQTLAWQAYETQDYVDRALMQMNTKIMAKSFGFKPVASLLSAGLGVIGGCSPLKRWVADYFMYGWR